MASPVTIKRGCCIVPLIITVVVILALILGAVALVNMTPNQLKLGDYEIMEGVTIRESGLGDIKIKDIFSFIKNLASPDRDKIVDNPYDPEVEKEAAENNFEGAGELPRTTGGEIDYTALLENNVVYDEQYLIEYNDTTLAYIFNEAITQAQQGSEEEHLKEIGAQIEQISVLQNDSGYRLKVIFSADIFGVKEEIKNEVGNSVPDFVINNLPEKVYFTSFSILSADAEGKLTAVPDGIAVNGMEKSPLTDAIINALSRSGENQSELDDSVGEAFANMVYKLGKTGSADTDENNIVTGNIVLGAQGIYPGKITLITHIVP